MISCDDVPYDYIGHQVSKLNADDKPTPPSSHISIWTVSFMCRAHCRICCPVTDGRSFLCCGTRPTRERQLTSVRH